MKLEMNVLALGLVVFGLSEVMAAPAQAGGGYNGPITAGQSIPVELDRAVSLDGLTRTYQVCSARLAANIVRQYTKLTPADFDAQFTATENDIGKPNWRFSREINGLHQSVLQVQFQRYSNYDFTSKVASSKLPKLSFGFSQNYYFQIGGSYQSTESEAEYPKFVVSVNPTQEPSITNFRNFSLPHAEFNDTLNQAKYDELGNLDQSTLILTGLTFKIPSDYQDQVPLINDGSAAASSLNIDFRGFVDCLHNEIQK